MIKELKMFGFKDLMLNKWILYIFLIFLSLIPSNLFFRNLVHSANELRPFPAWPHFGLPSHPSRTENPITRPFDLLLTTKTNPLWKSQYERSHDWDDRGRGGHGRVFAGGGRPKLGLIIYIFIFLNLRESGLEGGIEDAFWKFLVWVRLGE